MCEINDLKIENKKLKKELKFLRSFYNENKNKVDTTSYYDSLFQDYASSENEEVLRMMFEKFPDESGQILTDIRDIFPDDIDKIATQFNAKKELQIIRKSNQLIKEYSKNKFFIEKSQFELVHDYIDYHTKNQPQNMIKVIKQVLIYYPFTIIDFMGDIKAYWFNDIQDKLTQIVTELYGDDNLLAWKQKKLEAERGGRINYKTCDVSTLIERVENAGYRKRREALKIVDRLKRVNRSDDVKVFKLQVNKLLRDKI